uniref:Uncharacterized protein n=1 Tax=Anguilla anguilla TaxID=7936 RepID=A0A0E9QZN7_ANGAN
MTSSRSLATDLELNLTDESFQEVIQFSWFTQKIRSFERIIRERHNTASYIR